jgi:hypothetical protein
MTSLKKLKAKAATTSAAFPNLAGGLEKIADLVASRLAESSSTAAPKLVEGVDKIVELVAAKLAERSNQVAQQTAATVDKIAELVAAKLATNGKENAKTLEPITPKLFAERRAANDIKADLKRFGLRTYGLLWGGVWDCKMYKGDKVCFSSPLTWPPAFDGEGMMLGIPGSFLVPQDRPLGFQGKSITIAFYRSDVDRWCNPQANTDGGYSILEWTSLEGTKAAGYEHHVARLGAKPTEIVISGQFIDYDNHIINYKYADGSAMKCVLKRKTYAWLEEEVQAELVAKKSSARRSR